jgi:hypothetical protein
MPLMGYRTPTMGRRRSISRRSLQLIDGSADTLLSGSNVPQPAKTILSNDENKMLLMARGMGLTRMSSATADESELGLKWKWFYELCATHRNGRRFAAAMG